MDPVFASLGSFFQYTAELMPALMQGAVTTIQIFVLTLVLALPLGIPLSLGSMSKFPPLKILCKTYIWLFRGTPLILQLFFFYFFIPIIFPSIMLNAYTTAIITFVLNYTAYFAEIYRGGIESIDIGQHEAARSLGLSKSRTMMDIIIPQTIKRVLPPVSNEAITLIKDTALVSVISVGELLKAANGAVNRDSNPTAFLIAAVIYLFFTFLLTLLSSYLEKRFSRHLTEGVR
ncbi:MAG: amino acid ABC transporter permease [Clostridia bacterium]